MNLNGTDGNNNMQGNDDGKNLNSSQDNNLNGSGQNPKSPTKKVFSITTHGLKKTVVKDLNHHITTIHKDQFKCDQCTKVYSTANGLTKHKGSHKGFSLKCAVCGDVKQFQSELTEHMRTHTGTGMFPCDYKSPEGVGCRLRFISKRTMIQHKEVHSLHHYHCNPCKKHFKTTSLLYQHQRTVHTAGGGGYTSYCTFTCNNPSARKCHQDTCTTCQQQKPEKKYKS